MHFNGQENRSTLWKCYEKSTLIIELSKVFDTDIYKKPYDYHKMNSY